MFAHLFRVIFAPFAFAIISFDTRCQSLQHVVYSFCIFVGRSIENCLFYFGIFFCFSAVVVWLVIYYFIGTPCKFISVFHPYERTSKCANLLICLKVGLFWVHLMHIVTFVPHYYTTFFQLCRVLLWSAAIYPLHIYTHTEMQCHTWMETAFFYLLAFSRTFQEKKTTGEKPIYILYFA